MTKPVIAYPEDKIDHKLSEISRLKHLEKARKLIIS